MPSSSKGPDRTITRRAFVRTAAGAAALPVAAQGIGSVSAQPARGKPFAGKTLNVFMFDHPYLLPQFTELTGIKVEMDTPGFLVYNQRADLELSTGSGAYDVMALTFIFSGKWIGAGWSSRLNDFIARDGATDAADFLSGAMVPMKSGSDVFGLPFVAESTLQRSRRAELRRAAVVGRHDGRARGRLHRRARVGRPRRGSGWPLPCPREGRPDASPRRRCTGSRFPRAPSRRRCLGNSSSGPPRGKSWERSPRRRSIRRSRARACWAAPPTARSTTGAARTSALSTGLSSSRRGRVTWSTGRCPSFRPSEIG